MEKSPLFALAAASCVVTLWAQRAGGSVVPLQVIPLADRLANAVTAYAAYLWKMIWPAKLAPMYLYSQDIPVWTVAVSIAFVAAVTAVAIRAARTGSLGWITFGWTWYVAGLAPVIGVVQVGPQSMADRYTYIPLIGPFIIVTWSAALVAGRLMPDPRKRYPALAIVGCLVAGGLVVKAHEQAGWWRDNLSLYRHAVQATDHSSWAEVAYAGALGKAGRLDESIRRYEQAMGRYPDCLPAESGLAVVLAWRGRYGEAERHLRRLVELSPDELRWVNNLGLVLLYRRKAGEAVEQFEKVLQADPDFPSARDNLRCAREMLRGQTP